MTDIEVLLTNVGVVLTRLIASGIGLWALAYFAQTLVREGGRNPMKIGLSLGVIALAGAGFKLVPSLLQSGESTGDQLKGGGGAYSMPSLGTLPADPDNVAPDRAAFTPTAITTTHQGPGRLVPVRAADTALQAAA